MTVEILYLAWNRLDFTRASFTLLLAHTDWTLVDRLVVYDDGSTDGTREWLRAAIEDADGPALVEFRKTKLRSPVAIMCDYLEKTDADVFAKIDSDIALPPGPAGQRSWLPAALEVIERSPDLDLLGLAAGWTGNGADGYAVGRGWQRSSHIGGVGLMRTDVFRRYPDLWANGRYGLTEWQHRHPGIGRGWITPDLPVVQLDLIPEEPWRSLAEMYVARKWARPWPPYAAESAGWWAWLDAAVAA